MQSFRNIINSLIVATLLLSLSNAALPQTPQPDGAGVRPGTLPKAWLLAGLVPNRQEYRVNDSAGPGDNEAKARKRPRRC